MNRSIIGMLSQVCNSCAANVAKQGIKSCLQTRNKKQVSFKKVQLTSQENMYFQVVFMYSLLKEINASTVNDLVVDYFVYKGISRVVGYSCNLAQDDLLLVKKFSDGGLAVALSNLTLESNIQELANTTTSKIGIFMDTRCYAEENIISIFNEATDYRMFDELHDWLILGYNLGQVIDVINDKAFGLATSLVIAISDHGESFDFYDVYNSFKHRGGILNVTFYGDWSTAKGLSINLTQSKLARRSNLHGLRLRAMFFQSPYRPPSMPIDEYLQDYKNTTKDGRSKFGYITLKHLGDMYNFTFESTETKKWEPGDPLGPLTYAMANFEADVTGSPFNINMKRTYLMKFVHPDWRIRTCFIFRNPQPTTIKMNEIFRPFANSIWVLLCINIVVIIFTFNMALSYDCNESQIMRMSNSFITVMGALCQQGSDIKMTRVSTRIIFIFVMTTSLLLYNYYSACVVSARLDEPIYKINDSLVELGKMNLRMASEKIVYLEYFFRLPYWETKIFHRDYWSKIPESRRYMDPEMGVPLVQKGGFAYNAHPETVYPLIDKLYDNREICELMEVHLARPAYTMFAVTNNCTFTEVMRVGLSRLAESGLRDRELKKWQYKKPKCRKDILNAASINIYEFAPHLIFLIIGALMAIMVYILEIIHSKWIVEIKSNHKVAGANHELHTKAAIGRELY